jgi:Glycosyltransferase family 87
MSSPSPPSPEAYGLGTLFLLLLSPLVLQGLLVPLAQRVDMTVDAPFLTHSAQVLPLLVGLTARLSGRRDLPVLVGGLAALGLGLFQAQEAEGRVLLTVLLLAVALFDASLLSYLLPRLPQELNWMARRQPVRLALLFALGLLGALVTTREGTFVADHRERSYGLVPENDFINYHSCMSAYVQAARLARDGVENIYAADLWWDQEATPQATAYKEDYLPFRLDSYAYPPPFLLVPSLLAQVGNFMAQRAVWFALSGLYVALGLWMVGRWVGGTAGRMALLMIPLVWVSTPSTLLLHIGNAHGWVVVSAMLALVAFERRRPALGGLLLAFAIISKISPGLLLLVLLVQRRFREVAWTLLGCLLFTAAGIALYGTGPLLAFVRYELPRLASGAALRFLAEDHSVPINIAPFGIPFKLAALGLPLSDPWAVARGMGTLYSVVIVVVTAIGAWRGGGRRAQAELWAGVLTLAALRSPLAPVYAMLSLVWLFSLRAVDMKEWRSQLGLALLWIFVIIGAFDMSRPLLLVSLLQQIAVYAVTVYCILCKAPADDGDAEKG